VQRVCLPALALFASTYLVAQTPNTFALHDGDRVVFLGDSITAQRFYTTYFQTAVHARYPEWTIEFYNAGVGGDNVFGGVAGDIDTRLTRDVLDFHPTVITIMLGMNDRGHPDKYEEGYKHILEVLHDKASSARIVILAPTPVDGVTNNNPVANKELRSFVEIDRRLAAAAGSTFIDLFHPVEVALERADKIDHLAALSLIPDRIHPQPPLHMLMAETILHGLGFPTGVSFLTIDASTVAITHSDEVTARDLRKQDDALSWSETEAPDEIRFLRTDGNAILYQKLLGATHPGARILQITALPKGTYALKIDGKLLSKIWTDTELATGIDLQMEDTPAHKSGVFLYYACSDAELNQTERSRQLGALKISNLTLETTGKAFFQAAMSRSAEKIKAASARTERRIELLPAAQSMR
jgi:lysophospholipase L1-like esterase